MTTNNNPLWYTRRDKEIRGPFPKKLIGRYILIGRVRESDEVSVDQRNWQRLSAVPELIPEEMKADLSIPENQEKLRLARLREDERRYGDRRQLSDADLQEAVRRRRSGQERRDSETIDTLRHRLIKTQTNRLISQPKKNYRKSAIALAVSVAMILGIASLYSPAPQENADHHCEQAAQPKVYWSNCRFEGLQLDGVDLHGAKLQNTSLIAATIRGSDLSHADMAYSNLLNADLSNTNFASAKLVGAVLRRATMSGANLQNSDLSYAILQDVDLSNADLHNANLEHAMLSGANITNTNFSGATLDNAIWLDNSVCAPGSVGRCVLLPTKN